MFFQIRQFSLGLIFYWLASVSCNELQQPSRLAQAAFSSKYGAVDFSIQFVVRLQNGKSNTEVFVHYQGLKKDQKFSYRIHEQPIPGTDCNSAGDVWNPTNSNWNQCDQSRPTRCKSGDLSGKHGSLKGNVLNPLLKGGHYWDASLKWSSSPRGILEKSIVIADADGKPVACGTIKNPTPNVRNN